MEECQLSIMWEEIIHHFPGAVFISYHDLRTRGRHTQRLKFLPTDSENLDDYMVLVYDGKRFCYLIGLDGLLQYERRSGNV